MAYEVVWSPEAIEDLESIADYIARDSPQYAMAVVEKALDTASKLSHFPFAGRIVPEVDNENIREKFVHSYRLIYRIEDEEVTIVAVIHGKRLCPLEIE
ncbi:MAG TPA: type II toxin-antitoxin system RelE/ParE family toxin [Blastocatellia bacterium]|nr:type II toxin-antitoxin system RelE/ParE family toxin [Blastocatellia bacterium]